MNTINIKPILILFFLFSIVSCKDSNDNIAEPEKSEITVVDYYGQLSINGTLLVDKKNNPVALRGMSLFWSQWGGKYYNKECIKWLRNDWKCTIVRASMGIEAGGYLTNAETEFNKITEVIEACIDLGIYVIVDWHDHNAQNHLAEAKDFFSKISNLYGNKPNIIYEIFNEPLNVSWSNVIKPYAEEIITTIRENDKKNIIVVGTPTWSQDVDAAAKDPLAGDNIAYSLHFYTGTHNQSLRNKAITAINKGLALFVTEFGISEADGNGKIDMNETNLWISFLEQYNLSWCNWSIMDKDETSAALNSGSSATGNWAENELKESGKILRDYIRTQNNDIFDILDEMNN